MRSLLQAHDIAMVAILLRYFVIVSLLFVPVDAQAQGRDHAPDSFGPSTPYSRPSLLPSPDILVPPGAEFEDDGLSETKHRCYSRAETHDRIKARRLREPFALMRIASRMMQADAIGARLCRANDEDIFDISLLRSDGQLIHVFFNSATGEVLRTPPEP